MTSWQELTRKPALPWHAESPRDKRADLHVQADSMWHQAEWDLCERKVSAAVMTTENEATARKSAARWVAGSFAHTVLRSTP